MRLFFFIKLLLELFYVFLFYVFSSQCRFFAIWLLYGQYVPCCFLSWWYTRLRILFSIRRKYRLFISMISILNRFPAIISYHDVELVVVAVYHPVVGELQQQVHQFVVQIYKRKRHYNFVLHIINLN